MTPEERGRFLEEPPEGAPNIEAAHQVRVPAGRATYRKPLLCSQPGGRIQSPIWPYVSKPHVWVGACILDPVSAGLDLMHACTFKMPCMWVP